MIEIKLTKEKVALIDEDDFDLVSQYNWCAEEHRSTYYAYNSVRDGKITHHTSMHRLIMGAQKGQFVDHINKNGLDNRKENLRLCTSAQNQGNRKISNYYGGKICSSSFKGVSWGKHMNKWSAQICREGKKIHLGCFPLEDDAARAYDKAALEYFGEFAYLNFQES